MWRGLSRLTDITYLGSHSDMRILKWLLAIAGLIVVLAFAGLHLLARYDEKTRQDTMRVKCKSI
jgi:hypothetical protein